MVKIGHTICRRAKQNSKGGTPRTMKATLPYVCMNIGKETYVPKHCITGILNFEIRPVKDLLTILKEQGKTIIDVTGAKKTKSIILTTENVIYRSPFSPKALSGRYTGEEELEENEAD